MARRELSKRHDPNAPKAIHLPPELRRTTPRGRSAKKPADYLARLQCVGTAKGKLKRYWLKRMTDDGHTGLPANDDPKYRYSEIAELARTLGYDTDIHKMDPVEKAKCRCEKPAIAGGMVCRFHGGSAKQVIQGARDNMYAMLMPAQARLVKIIVKGKHEPAVVAAIKEVFDVTGLKKPEVLGNSEGYSEELIARMADVFTEEQLSEFIKLSRMLQSALPEDGEETGPRKLTEGTTPALPAKTIQVGPAKMAELIKVQKKSRKAEKPVPVGSTP